VNLYAYVGNSVVNYVDLMGTEKVLILYSKEDFWNIIFSNYEVSKNIKSDLVND